MFWCILFFFSRDEPVYKLRVRGIQYEGEHFQQLLQHGVTESSSSQYSSPIFDAYI
jgi:hypothetical protein